MRKSNVCKVTWGDFEAAISEMGEAIRNTLLRAVNKIRGCYGAENDLWNLRGLRSFTI